MALQTTPPCTKSIQKLRKILYHSHEREKPIIQEAMVIADTFRNQPVFIHPDELIAGDELRQKPSGQPISMRTRHRSDWGNLGKKHPFFRMGMLHPGGNHTTVDFNAIMKEGFNGFIRRIDNSSLYHNKGEGRDFLNALRIVAQGYIDFCKRHGDLAETLAVSEQDPKRKGELLQIAENCYRVIADPPQDFWQACQACWFAFFFIPDAPGRIDQYLFPFYQQECNAGTLDHDRAKEILSCLWIKYFVKRGAGDGIGARHHLTRRTFRR